MNILSRFFQLLSGGARNGRLFAIIVPGDACDTAGTSRIGGLVIETAGVNSCGAFNTVSCNKPFVFTVTEAAFGRTAIAAVAAKTSFDPPLGAAITIRPSAS